VFFEVLHHDKKTRPGNYPVSQDTDLGWIVSGKIPLAAPEVLPRKSFFIRNNDNLDQQLQRLWEIEELPNKTWTDSTIVLSWLATSAGKWKTFVANRVSQIQELTAGCEWRHVSSASNPADLISRGTNPDTLKNCRLWWVGPEWLSQHQEQWHPEPLPEQQEVAAVKVMVQCSPAEFITRFQRYQDYKE